MKDAIGQDLEIGKIYGYSNNQNGFTTAFTGTLKKFKEGKASLEVISRFRTLYNDDAKPAEINSKVINCKSNMIFKLN